MTPRFLTWCLKLGSTVLISSQRPQQSTYFQFGVYWGISNRPHMLTQRVSTLPGNGLTYWKKKNHTRLGSQSLLWFVLNGFCWVKVPANQILSYQTRSFLSYWTSFCVLVGHLEKGMGHAQTVPQRIPTAWCCFCRVTLGWQLFQGAVQCYFSPHVAHYIHLTKFVFWNELSCTSSLSLTLLYLNQICWVH